MQETIRDWQTKAEFVNGQTYRPVPADRIEAVQGDLMQAMQTYSLTLVDYKPLKGPVKAATKKKTNTSAKDGDKNKKDAPAPADYKAFSMSFTGSYENIMKYIGATDFFEVDTINDFIFTVTQFLIATFKTLIGLFNDILNCFNHKHGAHGLR